MMLRVRQRQGPRVAGDVADQAFADAQTGLVHGLLLQALGGEQLQDLAGAQQIDGADLRHHLAGDQLDRLVEPQLRRAAARHHVAQALEQHARAGRGQALSVMAYPEMDLRAIQQGLERLFDQVLDDLGGRLFLGDHADALAGHHRAGLDVAVDHRAAQRAGPEMLDLELRRLLVQLAASNRSITWRWMSMNLLARRH